MAKKRATRGQPSKYLKGYDKLAKKLCLLGAVDKELAQFFGVAESTLNVWKLTHGSFASALRAGKLEADAKVAESLYKLATGLQPNVTAQIFWLKNRASKQWRDKVDHTLSGPDGGPVMTSNLTPEQAADVYKQNMR